jgi:hypothetical protein
VTYVRVGWPALAAVVLMLAPHEVWAVDGVKPRSLVIWGDDPCMTVVDRSVDPVVHLPYCISFEDPEPGEGLQAYEVADSRTHQFLATARSVDLVVPLPSWVTHADIDAYALLAVEHDPLFEAAMIDPEDVFETSTMWAGAWLRINGDDERRPAKFEVAAEGVDWNTASVPAGVYEIHGYTYEPPLNQYGPLRRNGVVKVVDGPDLAQSGPAVAFETIPGGIILYRNGATLLTGCVDAMEGTTLTAEWSPYGDVAWTPFAQDVEITGESFELELVAPEPLAGASGMLRVTARDPMGREYTSYLSTDLTVLAADNPGACNDSGSGFIQGPGCGDESDSSGGGEESSSSGSCHGPHETAPDDPSGCDGCRSSEPRDAVALVVAVLALVRRSRVTRATRRQ